MSFATVSSKGQITLPVAARRQLGIRPHDRITIEGGDNEIVIRKIRSIFEIEGFLGKALSSKAEREAMMDAASDHVRGSNS